jgi:hypothetical protein
MKISIFIQPLALILITLLYADVEADCLGEGRCNWEPWKAWSACSRTCGGGTRSRSRLYCCKASLASDISACLRDCYHDLDYYYRYNSESKVCNQQCYNGGSINWNNDCICSDIFYGTCCEKRK